MYFQLTGVRLGCLGMRDQNHIRGPRPFVNDNEQERGPRWALSGIPRKSPTLAAAARSEFVADGQLGRQLGK